MKEFYKNLLDEICNEEKIKYTNISQDFISILEKDGKSIYINTLQRCLNSQIASFFATDKYALHEILSYLNIPVVKTVLFWNIEDIRYEETINKKIDFLKDFYYKNNHHIVLKPNRGYGGKNIFNITDINQIEPAFRNLLNITDSIIVNPFYNIKNEHRIIMLNGECRLAFTKFLPENGWQFNLSKGSKAVKLNDGELKSRLVDLATKVYNGIGATFVSIDIIEDYNGNLCVLEVNNAVTLNKYIEQNPNDYELVKNIYKDVVRTLFKT